MGYESNGPGCVLIADDDPAVLRLITSVLEGEGYTTVTAADGMEAFQLLNTSPSFAAAVIDVNMPQLEGIELVKYMQSDPRLAKIPVIIMTGENDSLHSSESFSAGAVAFLPKPFTISQLSMMLRMFIRQAELKAGK